VEFHLRKCFVDPDTGNMSLRPCGLVQREELGE
jgi:hypothetical protein